MKKARLLPISFLICLLLLTSCRMPFYPTASPTVESGTPSLDSQPSETLEVEDTSRVGTLDAELEKVGITGYNQDKLRTIDLYYSLYFIGGELPNKREIAQGIRSFMDRYFPEIDQNDRETMTSAVILSYQQAVGDRYATYFDQEAYQEQQKDQDAEFVGIGVYVSYYSYENAVQVLAVYEGTPAANAGILPGDYIISVNGVSLDEIGYYELVNRIRGEVDTYVTVGVKRNGEEKSFTMIRQRVEGVSVTHRQLDGHPEIGYVKIDQFNQKTFEQFKKAIDDLTLKNVEGIIFDLRGNPGGEVNSIVNVLDYLLPDGEPIAYFRYDQNLGKHDVVYKGKDGHEVTLPMVVLCDQYTASAGELFTAALRDYEAATIVGVQTYGKGTAQNMISLHDGTAFTISTARYDPPKGGNYEGVGVAPHIVVELSEEAASVNAFLRDDAIDNQLQEAIKEINRLRTISFQ